MYRKLFLFLNVGMLGIFALAYWVDYDAEWKKYQKQYLRLAAESYEKEAAGAGEEKAKALKAEAKKLRSQWPEIKQIITKDLGRVDRCITCHVGMDEYSNPTMKNDFTEHPYKAHPQVDTLGKNHQFTKYGCTVCHGGQGLATTLKDAHGDVHNWEKPLLREKFVQASCARCHADFETLKGAEVAATGKKLFSKHGCQACHAIHGFGGAVSEPLEAVADKPRDRISKYHYEFMKRKGKPIDEHHWNLENWVLGHLINDPMVVVPNDPHAHYNPEPIAPSGMPDFTGEISEEGAEAIATYLLSMTAEPLPHKYYVFKSKEKENPPSDPLKHGKYVFEKYGCQGCHGLEAKQGRRNFNAMGPGQEDHEKDMEKGRIPTLVDVVGSYKHDELKAKISAGVSHIDQFNPKGPAPPLMMPSWKDRIKGKELDDLASWLLSIAKKDDSGF